jgi:hypothetical protein
MIEEFPAYRRKSNIVFIIDLVEDNVRSRIVYPLCATLLFLMLVFIVTNSTNTVPLSRNHPF